MGTMPALFEFKATNKELKNDASTSPIRAVIETETGYIVNFEYKNKRHIGVVDKTAIVNGEGQLKEYDLEAGQTVMFNRFAKQSEWLRKHNKADQALLLAEMGKWHPYLGKGEHKSMLVQINGREFDIPVIYIYNY